MTRRGFTIVELIIVITIIGILLTLAVVSLNGSQEKARDDERKADIQSIAQHLEALYTSGIPTTDNAPFITNQFGNPSAEISTTNLVTQGNTSIARSNTWSANGNYSVAVTPTAGTNDTAFAVDGGPNAFRSGMQAGKTYTASGTIYTPTALTGSLHSRAQRIAVFYKVGASHQEAVSEAGPTTGQARLTLTFTVPADATDAFVRFYNGASSGNGIVYWDRLMLVESTTAYDYADGNSTGWSWNGTHGLSMSSGPAVVLAKPGVYPNTSLTDPDLLLLFLPDIDERNLKAPGVDAVADSFIAATNNVETAEGVLPQPTIDQYVYQPLNRDGDLCADTDCRKFNLYYRLEGDDTVYKYESKNR